MDETKTVEKKITLDGKEITLTELEEAQKNQAVRIVETESGEFKTLQRLKE